MSIEYYIVPERLTVPGNAIALRRLGCAEDTRRQSPSVEASTLTGRAPHMVFNCGYANSLRRNVIPIRPSRPLESNKRLLGSGAAATSEKLFEFAENDELPPEVDIFDEVIVSVKVVTGANVISPLTGLVAPTLLAVGQFNTRELAVKLSELLPVTPQVTDPLIP